MQTQSRQQTSGYLHQQIAVPAFHGGLSLCGQRFNRYICHAVPSCYSLLRFVTEPANITGSHNQCSGFFVGQPFDISQIINALFGEIFQRTNATAASLNAKSRSHPSRFSRSSAGLLSPRLFPGLCNGGQCIFSTLAQCFNGRLIKAFDFQQLFHRAQASSSSVEKPSTRTVAKSSSMSRYL